MSHVEPLGAPFVSQISFGLCDLIGVVREHVVDSAAVDIAVFSEMLHGDAGALDVPARISHLVEEGRLPLESLILKLGLSEPENEVSLVLLIGVLFNAFSDAYCQIFLLMLAEYVVFVQLGSIEVNVSAGLVSVAFVKEHLNHVDVFGDQVCGGFHNVRSPDVQFGAV